MSKSKVLYRCTLDDFLMIGSNGLIFSNRILYHTEWNAILYSDFKISGIFD